MLDGKKLTRPMGWFLWMSGALIAPVAGCDDEAKGPVDVTIGAWNAAYAEVVCDNLVRCEHLRDDVIGLAMQAKAAPEACPGWIEQALARMPGGPARLVADGSVTYTQAASGECLAALRSSCRVEPWAVPECQDAFAGTIQKGQRCEVSAQCAAGLECDFGGCGTCVEATPVTRVDGLGAGAACGYVDSTPTSPASFRDCADGLYCTEAGTCAPRTPVGQGCADSDECADNSLCLVELGLGTTCGSVPIRNQVGAACSDEPGPDFAVCNGMLGLTCHEGTCKQNGDGARGSVCYPETDSAPCDAGLRCDAATSRCADLLEDGAACEQDSECASRHCEYGMDGGVCGAETCE